MNSLSKITFFETFIQMCARSPLSALLALILLFSGIYSVTQVPRQLEPTLLLPVVEVTIDYPTVSTQPLQDVITNPLQQILKTVAGVEHIYARALRGRVSVTLQFQPGTEPEMAFSRVQAQLSMQANKLPLGVSPQIRLSHQLDRTLMLITLWSFDADETALRTLATGVIQQLSDIEGLSESTLIGGQTEQMRIEVLPERLTHYNITLEQIAQALKTSSAVYPLGQMTTDQPYLEVASWQDVNEMSELPLGTFQNQPIRIRDVARVTRVPDNAQQSISYFPYKVDNRTFNRQQGIPFQWVPVPALSFFQVPKNFWLTFLEAPQFTSSPVFSEKRLSHSLATEILNSTSRSNERLPAIKLRTVVSPQSAPAVSILITNKIGSDEIDVAHAVRSRLADLRGWFINDVNVEILRDQGKITEVYFNHWLLNITAAISLIILLTGFSLELQAAMVMVSVILIVLLGTHSGIGLLGLSMNRSTAMGYWIAVIFAIMPTFTILTAVRRQNDCSTTIIANALRPWGWISAILASALLSVGLIKGIIGYYFFSLVIASGLALGLSVLISTSFTPWLLIQLSRLNKVIRFEFKRFHLLSREASIASNQQPTVGKLSAVDVVFAQKFHEVFSTHKRRWLVVGGVTLVFVISLNFWKMIRIEVIPVDKQPFLSVLLDMSEGTELPITIRTAQQVLDKLRQFPEVEDVQLSVGTALSFSGTTPLFYSEARHHPWQAELLIPLADSCDVQVLADNVRHVINDWIEAMNLEQRTTLLPPGPLEIRDITLLKKHIPINMAVLESKPLLPMQQSVVAEVYGSIEENRRAVTEGITAIFKQVASITTVGNSLVNTKGRWQFNTDSAKNLRYGVVAETIQRHLTMAFVGQPIGYVFINKKSAPLLLSLQVAPARENAVLQGYLPIPTMADANKTVLLKELGTFSQPRGETVHYQKDLRTVNYVFGQTLEGYTAVQQAEKRLSGYITPEGVALEKSSFFPVTSNVSHFIWGGLWTITHEIFYDLNKAFLATLILVYLIGVIYFSTLGTPLLPLLLVPLTFIGILPAHFLSNTELTATSVLGSLLLAVIVLGNSYLLLHTIIRQVQHLNSSKETAILKGCQECISPLILIGASIIIATFFMTDPIFEGLRVALSAGMFVATLLIFIVIPLGCFISRATPLCTKSGKSSITTPVPYHAQIFFFNMLFWLRLWHKVHTFFLTIINGFRELIGKPLIPFPPEPQVPPRTVPEKAQEAVPSAASSTSPIDESPADSRISETAETSAHQTVAPNPLTPVNGDKQHQAVSVSSEVREIAITTEPEITVSTDTDTLKRKRTPSKPKKSPTRRSRGIRLKGDLEPTSTVLPQEVEAESEPTERQRTVKKSK